MTTRLFLLACLTTVVSGCVDPFPAEPDNYQYRATIRWTEHGIPHILADDRPSVFFGQGYAFARLNGCILADQIVKVRSQRAKFFGPGPEDANVDSDFLMLHRGLIAAGEAGFAEQDEGIQAAMQAYSAGYNEFIATRSDELPCGGASWVRPITPEELMAYYIDVAGLASARQLSDFILAAVPPSAGLEMGPDPAPRATPDISTLGDLKIGSNGWGIGKDRSFNGRGMLLANPHFPWQGELKLMESHLRVPGDLDVYGAGLMGVLGVLIGFNDAVAWTHTVSAGNRFTIYALTLDPSDPTVYMVDGEPRPMEANEYAVEVLGDDGEITETTRTLYRSHHGPIIAPVSNGLPWTRETAYTYRDANANNITLIKQFLGMNEAESLDAFKSTHAEVQGIPWVNTIAASAQGEAWYTDSCPTPNLSPDALQRWQDSLGVDPIATLFYSAAGAVVLDGSDSRNEWVADDGAREPGLVPFARMPQLSRSDFVFNANDSYWSTNPAEPLEGYSPLHGAEGTARSPRTRMNAVTLTETGQGTASGADGRFDLDELRVAALSNRGMMAELLRDDVVARCQGVGEVSFEFESPPGEFEIITVDVRQACDVLEQWDRRLDVDSVGAIVWREFLGDFASASFLRRGQLFADAFEVDDWVGTPRRLPPAPDDDDPDRILEALAAAVHRLSLANVAVDASVGEAQFTKKYETRVDPASPDAERVFERIPIHGGGRNEGVTNLIVYDSFKSTLEPDHPRGEVINSTTDLTTEGYVVNYGTSFIMTTEFTDDGPRAFAFVTYSQSDDPLSPYHADQTKLFSEERWREVVFTEDAIEDDPELAVEVVFGL